MNQKKGFHSEKLSFSRKAVIASASVTRQKNSIHSITEVDISKPRALIKEYEKKHGIRLSFTGYIVKCLAAALSKHPRLNSFISGNRLIYLDDIVVSVLIERQINGASVPEPLAVRNCGNKSCLEIHTEIRKAQEIQNNYLGGLDGNTWFRLIPSFLLKAFIRLADRSVRMGIKYGKIAVTAVGMHTKNPLWMVPHGSATVLLTIGSIAPKAVDIDGTYVTREHLCLTVSFDHDIVDGAPAVRFMDDLIEEIKSGSLVADLL